MEITGLYNDTELLDDMTKPYTENKAFLELFGIFNLWCRQLMEGLMWFLCILETVV